MKVSKYSISGNVIGEVELPDSLFAAEINDSLIYELIKAANANLHQGTHKTKQRAEVRGGGIKPWKQKGTGRARAGSTRSPIWVGGGTVFGPVPRSYRVELPKKIKEEAYRSLFSLKAKEGAIKVVEDFNVNGKTKEIATIGKALLLKKGLLLGNGEDSMIRRAIKNIAWFKYNNVKRIYSRDIFYSKELLITESALTFLNKKFSEGNAQ